MLNCVEVTDLLAITLQSDLHGETYILLTSLTS